MYLTQNWVIRVISVLVAVTVLLFAIALDLLLGDPSPNNPEKTSFKLHPAVLMGKFTKTIQPHFKSPNPKKAKIKGALLALIVIFTFTLPAYFGLWAIYTYLSIFVYAFFATILLKLTICIKLETEWAKAATKAIEAEDLTEAKKYSHFSRRDSRDLVGSQISSAVIESMAENLIDFKLSPILSYAFFGTSGAIAFKAINTLDGMVGFKDAEHLHIGWFSANLDTVVNYIPARFTAILIVLAAALTGENWKNAWAIAKRDHAKTPSRNHGWTMAAMAGALCVQLEKPGQYKLGEQIEPLTPNKIIRALKIRNTAIILCVLFVLPIIWLTRLYLFSY
ncbi:MAG: cobalamin biosynthesis protein [Candidatus Bathyarchaeota archaeon]|nr:cobalamin biosynthesis protein [Candidatus Bathyarchaeota archaeon]